jgi:hydrogenase-4 component B
MSALDFLLLSVFLYVAGAVIALLLNKTGRFVNYVTCLFAFVASLAGIVSAAMVLTSGAGFTYDVAGWIPFTHFVIAVDQLSAFFILVISCLVTAVSLYSFSYLEEYLDKNPGVLGFLLNLFVASMILVVSIGNAFYFMLFWEAMTLTSYFLVIYEQDRESVRAGFLYFMVAHAGAILILVSFLIFFAITGSFNFAAYRLVYLAPGLRSLVFLLAFVGFCAKAGAVPLHFWLPEAHSAAPSNVSSLLSGVMIKTAIYGIIRVCMIFLGTGAFWWWGLLALLIGIISAVVGIIYAVNQHDLKRLLAYSSVENIGIILMGIGSAMIGLALQIPALVVLGLLASLYHVINHAAFKGLLFLGAGSVLYRMHTRDLNKLGGLAKVMPVSAFLFLAGAISISAIPPLNGFVSKWWLYQSLVNMALNGGLGEKLIGPLFVLFLAMTGALTAMCFVKAYGVTFAGPMRNPHAVEVKEVPFMMLLGKSLLVLACLVLGIGAPWIAPMIADAVSGFMGQPALVAGAGMYLFPGSAAQGVFSTPLLAILLIGLLLLPLIIMAIYGGLGAGKRLDASPWATGYQYKAAFAATSRSFAEPLQVIFSPVFMFTGSLRAAGPPIGNTFKAMVPSFVDVEGFWEKYVGKPLANGVQGLGRVIQYLQSGNVRLYCAYIILALVVLLIVVRF